jgi:hypothetical protein
VTSAFTPRVKALSRLRGPVGNRWATSVDGLRLRFGQPIWLIADEGVDLLARYLLSNLIDCTIS